MGQYGELPPVDLYADGYDEGGDNGDYEEYLSQSFMASPMPAPSAAPVGGNAAAQVSQSAQASDLPPWDLEGSQAISRVCRPHLPPPRCRRLRQPRRHRWPTANRPSQ